MFAKAGNSLHRQIEAARLRLIRELGRYLVCLDGNIDELNEILAKQMSRDIASARRLRKCIDLHGGYPEWSDEIKRQLKDFRNSLGEGHRDARLLGSELDAALDDPRWKAITQLRTTG